MNSWHHSINRLLSFTEAATNNASKGKHQCAFIAHTVPEHEWMASLKNRLLVFMAAAMSNTSKVWRGETSRNQLAPMNITTAIKTGMRRLLIV